MIEIKDVNKSIYSVLTILIENQEITETIIYNDSTKYDVYINIGCNTKIAIKHESIEISYITYHTLGSLNV